MTIAKNILPAVSAVGTYRAWQRNRDAFFKHWRTELWPPILEALVALAAFGIGVGSLITGDINGRPYIVFLAAGLIMSSVLFTSTIESMMNTFVRMNVERTFEAIIVTPVSLEEVVTGEIMWAATRALLTGTAVLVIEALFGLVPSLMAIALIPFMLLSGFMLSSMASVVIAIVPRMSSFSYFVSLGIYPMQLFSSIFFPLTLLPDGIRWIAFLSPLYPAVTVARNLFVGTPGVIDLFMTFWVAIMAIVFYYTALLLMRRRLLK